MRPSLRPIVLSTFFAAALAPAAAAQASDAAQAPAAAEVPAVELDAVDRGPELRNVTRVTRLLSREYPRELRDAGVTGSVVLRMRLDPQGTPDLVVVERRSGHTQFDEAAYRVAQEMRFRPARLRGRPVRVWVTLPVNFSLQGGTSAATWFPSLGSGQQGPGPNVLQPAQRPGEKVESAPWSPANPDRQQHPQPMPPL